MTVDVSVMMCERFWAVSRAPLSTGPAPGAGDQATGAAPVPAPFAPLPASIALGAPVGISFDPDEPLPVEASCAWTAGTAKGKATEPPPRRC